MSGKFRSLLRAPGYALTIILTLATGIGAAAAIGTVVNKVLIAPLPYPDSDEIVSVWLDAPRAPGLDAFSDGGLRPSFSMYFTLAEENTAFAAVGLWVAGTTTVTDPDRPQVVPTIVMTDGVFESLGIRPLIGRWLNRDDLSPDRPPSFLISHAWWQSRYGGDPEVLGRLIETNRGEAEIVGVMPEGFRVADVRADFFAGAQPDRDALGLAPFCCPVVARLKPDVSLQEANTDVARMLPIWLDAWPFAGDARMFLDDWGMSPALRPLKRDVVGPVSDVLWTVAATIAVVLSIACANVAGLMLVRAHRRRRESSIRVALGADHRRLRAEAVRETLILVAVGGLLGIAVAHVAIDALLLFGSGELPRLAEIATDGVMVVTATAVTVFVAGVLCLLAIVKQSKGPTDLVRASALNATRGREGHRLRSSLIVSQLALALVLLIGAGLMVRTNQALLAVDPGFVDPGQLQTLEIMIPPAVAEEPEAVARVQHQVMDAIDAIPGVVAASAASSVPLDDEYRIEGVILHQGGRQGAAIESSPYRTFKYIVPGWFETLGTPMIAGRDIDWADIHERRPVAIVSENLARDLWGSAAAALGGQVRVADEAGPERWREVVGVVADVREYGIDEAAPPVVYWPSNYSSFMRYVVRSPRAGDPALVGAIEQAVRDVNRGLPVTAARTMRDVYDQSLARRSFVQMLLIAAAAVATALGIVGLYGTLAYVLAQERREIAIRLAVGAKPRTVILSYVRSSLALAVAGVALGFGVAFAVTRYLESLLYDIRPFDPGTFVLGSFGVLVLVALASWLTTRRVSSIAPADVLSEQG